MTHPPKTALITGITGQDGSYLADTSNLVRISATQTGAYRIRLVFDDKKVQEVDFQPFLDHSHHPDIRAYLEPTRFSGFRLAYGELVWGDYELCFPVMDLYRNTIEHNEMWSEAA